MLRQARNWADELAVIAARVTEWKPEEGKPFSIGVAVHGRDKVAEVEAYLSHRGIAIPLPAPVAAISRLRA